MNYSDEEAIQSLKSVLSDLIPSIFGEGCELGRQAPVRLDRRYSFMFRFFFQTAAGELKPLRVKIHREIWMKTMQQAIESDHIKEVVYQEFQSLKYIENVISDSGKPNLFAIRPLVFIAELNALVMEEIPLEMLRTWIYKIRIMLGKQKDWQDFEKHIMWAGEWLRVIHDRSAKHQFVPLENLNLRNELDSIASNLEKRINKPLPCIRKQSNQLIDSLKKCEVPLSWLHKDFQLGNIFITAEGRVGALDPNWMVEGPIYTDLASFLIYPVICKLQIISRGSTFRPSLLNRYEDAFLQGYFGHSEIPYPILYLYCVRASLKRWLEVERILKTKTSRDYYYGSLPVLQYIRSYFDKLIRRYLSRGLQALEFRESLGNLDQKSTLDNG